MDKITRTLAFYIFYSYMSECCDICTRLWYESIYGNCKKKCCAKTIGGLLYKGELNIRKDNFLSKACLSQGTYIARNNIEIRKLGADNSTQESGDNFTSNNNPDILAVSALNSAMIMNLFKHKKVRIRYFPVILNIKTGELE